jgi:aspartate-semialdehyde dehydrogenase
MNIAIVGITGLVGQKIIEVLNRLKYPIKNLIPIASNKSYGKIISFRNKEYIIDKIDYILDKNPDIVFMACNSNISKIWCPILRDNNIWVIDNSSQFRMEENIPLIIPEINSYLITENTKLISNPNCSTAQLVMVLNPLHKLYGIKRVIISTYQSVSGAGYKGIEQLNNERLNKNDNTSKIFNEYIDLNCIALCGDLDTNTNYTEEEIKLEKETPKILNADIKVTATAVRVPIIGGHSESVNIEFENEHDILKIYKVLSNTKGVKVNDISYPKYVENKFDVFVSRIRNDYSKKNCINLWIVADNLYKGAALNSVQIAQQILHKFY